MTQTKVSQNNVNLNFASLPCNSSNSRLEENLTKLIYRQFQYRAQIKATKMQMCQTFQLESQKQFIQLKFVETQLGTGSNTFQIKLCYRFRLRSLSGFSQLNFSKVMFSQVIVSSSSRLNTAFPSYILLEVPPYDKLQVTLCRLYFPRLHIAHKKLDRGIKYKTLSS